MEREGREERGRGREGEGRRRGGEMRKGRRGIVIGGMVIGLLMGCNNGGEDPQKLFLKSVVSLGNDFLNVFTSFGDMVGDVLGFNEKTPKSKVGDYFKKVKETVEGTKTALEKIVNDMKRENNPNATSVEGAVNKLVNDKLGRIIAGASDAIKGASGGELLGYVAPAAANAPGAKGDGIDSLVKGIKEIVGVVLGKDEGNAEAGDDQKAEDSVVKRANSGDDGAGKLFDGTARTAIDSHAKKAANDAAKAVGAVTGSDILQAIAKGDAGNAAKLANTDATTANVTAPKDAEVAGAIALRAMAKGGKFANGNVSNDVTTVVKGAAISAVTKALNTLTVAIRKTIDEELKKVKETMNISPETTPATTEVGNVTK